MTEPAPWWSTDPTKLDELRQALGLHAPRLRLQVTADTLMARGSFELATGGEVQDAFAIVIRFDPQDAEAEPKVWEVGGAIERLEDNHVNAIDGSCCLGVVDEWLAKTGDTSFAGFFTGPLWNFFLSQAIFRRTGKWIFDQRSHGLQGMIEAYGELIGDADPTLERVARALSFLAIDNAKGHWLCPCGSEERVRNCCGPTLRRSPLQQAIATRLHDRLVKEAMKTDSTRDAASLRYRKH